MDGHLSCDEMKLNENIIWNMHMHEAKGFTSAYRDLDGCIRNIFCGDEVQKPATEVNLWKYRSMENVIVDCEFFYSGGDMTNADVCKQFLNVLTCLELIQCRVFGLSTDGNSVNVRAMKILSDTDMEIPNDQEWLDERYVSMKHPLDHSRRIFFWLCSTHQIKSMRNQLWTSRNNGKCHFLSPDGFPFGWEGVGEQFNREETRGTKISKLVLGAILLDGWAKMNVHYAKSVFAWDTLAEAVEYYICTEANLNVPILEENLYEGNVDCFCTMLWKGQRGPLASWNVDS
jgi:hypothetical protein